MARMAKRHANHRAAIVLSTSEISGPPREAVCVFNQLNGTLALLTSEEVEATQVFARRLIEGYGCSKAHLLRPDGHANPYQQSVSASATDASAFWEPTQLGQLQ